MWMSWLSPVSVVKENLAGTGAITCVGRTYTLIHAKMVVWWLDHLIRLSGRLKVPEAEVVGKGIDPGGLAHT